MKTNKIFQAGVNFMSNETMKQALRRASKANASLSQVINVIKRDLWDEMGLILPSLGIDDKADLTPAKVVELATTAGLTKTDKAGKVVVCKVCKVIEREAITLKDETGKEYSVKVAKVGKDGKEVVKYELKKIGAWTLGNLVEVLAQAQAVNEK